MQPKSAQVPIGGVLRAFLSSCSSANPGIHASRLFPRPAIPRNRHTRSCFGPSWDAAWRRSLGRLRFRGIGAALVALRSQPDTEDGSMPLAQMLKLAMATANDLSFDSLFSERGNEFPKGASVRAIDCERPATAAETTFSGRSSGGRVVSRWPILLGRRWTSDLVDQGLQAGRSHLERCWIRPGRVA